MTSKPSHIRFLLPAAAALIGLAPTVHADTKDVFDFNKPNWLSDLSVGAKESYDDNVLLVSGLGLPVQSSWVDDFTAKVGFNFVPFIPKEDGITTLSLVYAVDKASYQKASSENNTKNNWNLLFKGGADTFTWNLDEAFLWVDGNKQAPTYAENQLGSSAKGSNQNDKYRNNYAHSVARERRDQVQERYTASVTDTVGNYFIRPISQITFYNLDTAVYNTSNAPYKGYQDYIDRWDLNYGGDVGYLITPKLSIYLGYRDGYQHQDGYSKAINSDTHQASNKYQRLLFGLDGTITPWLTLKALVGPDFKDYNPDTAITHDRTTRYYGEGSAVVTLPASQSVTLSYKQWFWVSSTGLVPYEDTTVSLTYHIAVTPELGFDAGAKYLDANYTLGNDYAGSAPDLRDDGDYNANAAVTYTFEKHIVIALAYNYDAGRNLLRDLPAKYFGAYRDFTHNVTSLSVTLKL